MLVKGARGINWKLLPQYTAMINPQSPAAKKSAAER